MQMNRGHLMALTALTALVTFSQAARADDYSLPNTDRFERPEVQSQATCAQAQAFAWFRHQMELSDGGHDNTVPYPTECERTYVAVSAPDAGAYEESE
jgi:hypothetical protein